MADEIDRIISRYTDHGDGLSPEERAHDDAMADILDEYGSAHASERLAEAGDDEDTSEVGEKRKKRRKKRKPEVEEDTEAQEAVLCESAVGLAEIGGTAGDPRAPLLLDFALLRPGRGNKRDNHYYPPEVLKRDAGVFEGVKMYATDHRPEEKNVRTEVGIVRVCPLRFEADGTPIARASIFNPDFAEQVRNRAKAGVLDSLENSILATGKTKSGRAPDGGRANVVEAITKGLSVDFVTRAGAGGHAVSLAEAGGVTAVYDPATGTAFVTVPLAEDDDDFNRIMDKFNLRRV